jgi:hypothetical protein
MRTFGHSDMSHQIPSRDAHETRPRRADESIDANRANDGNRMRGATDARHTATARASRRWRCDAR